MLHIFDCHTKSINSLTNDDVFCFIVKRVTPDTIKTCAYEQVPFVGMEMSFFREKKHYYVACIDNKIIPIMHKTLIYAHEKRLMVPIIQVYSLYKFSSIFYIFLIINTI